MSDRRATDLQFKRVFVYTLMGLVGVLGVALFLAVWSIGCLEYELIQVGNKERLCQDSLRGFSYASP